MKFIVAIAGVPREVSDEIKSRPGAKFTGQKDAIPLVRSIKPPLAFREGMQDAFLSDIADVVTALNPSDEIAILLAYVDYASDSTRKFVDSFFPFALAGKIKPFYPDSFEKHERRSNLKKYVDDIEKVVSDLRSRARSVRDVFSGQNFHPLLLPLRNFTSEIVFPEVKYLYENIALVDSARDALNEAAEAILKVHPLQEERLGKERSRWFEDNKRLRFKSPGQNRHGMARRVGEGHNPTCLINGRVRLGGPFDSRFHYDCDYSRRDLDAAYQNCHSHSTAPHASTHVNIAPSDYIR